MRWDRIMFNGARPLDVVHFAALALMCAGSVAVWNLAPQARWFLMVDILLIDALVSLGLAPLCVWAARLVPARLCGPVGQGG